MNIKEPILIRASSLAGLFECPARWEAQNIRGLRTPSSGSARLGTAVHTSTALFDTSRMNGTGITPDEAADAAVDAIHKPDEEVLWDDLQPTEAERIALSLHRLYCSTIAPRQTYAAVEATCERLDIADLGIALTGTVDRVRRTEDGYGIADIKTGKSAVGVDGTCKTQGHTAQLAVYELLAEHSTDICIEAPAQIIGLQVAKTERGQRVATGTISGGRDLLIGDEEFPGLLEMAATLIHSGNFYGNPRSNGCGEKYCPIFNICKWRR